MKAVITKSFISRDLIPYIPYIAHMLQKSMYKHHCMKRAACEHIATLPRGTQRIVSIIITEYNFILHSHRLSTSTSTQPDSAFRELISQFWSGRGAVEAESQVPTRVCYTRDNDAYNALRASRQCCNMFTCRTLHAVMFIHRFLKYMDDI